MPGLRSKVFTFDPESGEATNVYVWESEAAALRFVELGALVDNGVAAPA